MNIDSYIRERLDGFEQTDQMPKNFIYLFGPYMCMTQGYEYSVDHFSKIYTELKVMQYGAYLIRYARNKIQSGYKELANFCRSFVIQLESDFPKAQYPEENKCLSNVVLEVLAKHKRIASESIVTDCAPIVPYQDPRNIECFEDSIQDLKMYKDRGEVIDSQLKDLLYNTLVEILIKADIIAEVFHFRESIHDFFTTSIDGSPEFKHYVKLAHLYFFQPSSETVDSSINFFSTITDISNKLDYDSFLNLIRSYSDSISLEAWDDIDYHVAGIISDNIPTEQKAEELEEENTPKYDLNVIYNLIALHREMRFDDLSKRQFTDAMKDEDKIININNLGKGIIAYEMQSGKLIVPFTDLITWSTKYMVMTKESNVCKIESLVTKQYDYVKVSTDVTSD